MIRINYPLSEDEYFFVSDDWAFGPFLKSGPLPYTLIEYRSDYDQLAGKRGFRHENDVINTQFECDITLSRGVISTNSNGSAAFPESLKVSSSGGPVTANLGWALQGAQSRAFLTTFPAQHFCEVVDGKIVTHELRRATGSTRVSGYVKRTYTLTFNGSLTVKVSAYTESWAHNYAHPVVPSWDWQLLPSQTEFLETCQNMISYGFRLTPTTYNNSRTLKSPGAILPTLEAARNWIYLRGALLLRTEPYPAPMELGELCLEAASRIPATDVNVIAFIRDLRNVKQLIPKLRNLQSLKGWSGSYLQWKYGILPTVDDLKSLHQSLLRAIRSTARYRVGRSGCSTSLTEDGITYSIQQHAKLIVDDRDQGYMRVTNAIENIGLLPTFENIWDLIPYSFCVDWLVDIGSYLKQLDSRLRLLRYDIRQIVLSVRLEAFEALSYKSPFPCIGSLKMVQYHRWTTSLCPLPSLTTLNTRLDLSNHILEASALLIQKRRSH